MLFSVFFGLSRKNNAKRGSVLPAFIFYAFAAFCPKNGGIF